MLWLQKIKDSPNYPRLKNSAQYRFDRRQFLLVAGILGAAVLIVFFSTLDLLRFDKGVGAFWTLNLCMLLAYLPIIALVAYHWLRLFLHIDGWHFSEAVLDQPHAGYKGGVYFTVEITDRLGNRKRVETDRIFTSAEPRVEDYVNHRVLIGYNEETNLVAVIQKLD